jgi:hypothetical protein
MVNLIKYVPSLSTVKVVAAAAGMAGAAEDPSGRPIISHKNVLIPVLSVFDSAGVSPMVRPPTGDAAPLIKIKMLAIKSP